MRRALLLGLLWFQGCLVTPDIACRVTLELSFSGVPVITRQSPNSWFLQATLSGADLERPVEATARGLAGSDADLLTRSPWVRISSRRATMSFMT